MLSSNSTYVREYVKALLAGEIVDKPDKALLNGFSEIVEALYHAAAAGGRDREKRASQATIAWNVIKDQRPNVEQLLYEPATPRRGYTARELAHLPKQTWLMNNLIPAKGLVVMYGAPGVGKSFVAFDISMRMSMFYPVLYVAAEGSSGYHKRLVAWETHHKKETQKLYFDIDPVNLVKEEEVNVFCEFWATIKPAMIVIDTLAMCMGTGDENSARDMGIMIQSCRLLTKRLGSTVMLIHHTGKTGVSERGSSALRGAADCVIEIKDADGLISAVNVKMKDAPLFDSMFWRGVPSEDSLVLVKSENVIQTKLDKLSRHQIAVLRALNLEVFTTTGAKATQVAKSSGVDETYIYKVLSSLKRLGYIRQHQKGDPFFITDEGKDAINQIDS